MINHRYTSESPECQTSRHSQDRRNNYIHSFIYSSFKRRRKKQRREVDSVENTFVDIHEPKLAYIYVFTLLLCITDALLTLNIISKGGEEVNPFMRFLMNRDEMLFFWVKFAMTAFGMLFLISHKNFTVYRVVKGYHLFYAIAAMYAVLINYQIILITQVIPTA